ncbi:MAG: methyltetrahydrofolate cobalamin methyltransferase, partial [Pseudomonadota bacterium]
IPMVIASGMTSAIMNPCRPQEMEMVHGANVLNATDPNCQNWIMTYRDRPQVNGAAPGASAAPDASVAAAATGGSRRRGGRRARA